MRQYIDTAQDISGNALPFATCTVRTFPGGALASIFSDNGLTPIGTSSVSADVTGQFSFFAADGDYTLQLFNNAVLYKTQSPVVLFDGAAQVTFPDTGAASAYAVSNSVLEKALRVGLRCSFLAANSATAASTFAYNTLAAKPIVMPGGASAGLGTILANGIYAIEYDGASWQLRSPPSSPSFGTTAQETAGGITPVNTSFFGIPWLWVRREGCVLDGATDDTVAFNKCLTVAAASGAPNTALLIDGPMFLNTSNITIPGNVSLIFAGAGKLKPGAGKTITLGQTPQAPLQQIFDLSSGGLVEMPTNLRSTEVWAEWWGAVGDNGATVTNNEVPINAAIASIALAAGSTGIVRLGIGNFIISAVISLGNYITLRGTNDFTKIRAKASGWAPASTMITASTGGSMFDSRIEYMTLDANNVANIQVVISSSGWQQRCGLFNCELLNFTQYGLFYTHGFGGAAVMKLENVDFFPNDVNGAVGAYFTVDSTIGCMKLNVDNCAFASGGVNATFGLWVDGRIICTVLGVDVEELQYGIVLGPGAVLCGAGLGAGGQLPAVVPNAVIRCLNTWTAGPGNHGSINISGAQIGGWTNMIVDSNRSYACASLEPYDGNLQWPPNLTKPQGVCLITGAGVPALANASSFGVCSKVAGASIVNNAVGQQTLTLASTMDASASVVAVGLSNDVAVTQVVCNVTSATTIQIFTKNAAGAATNCASILLYVYHTP